MDTIIFEDARLLPLVTDTTLTRCADLATHEDHYALTRKWPSISSGEEVLWGALDYLAGGDIPDVSLIAHKLDVGNAAVLAAVVDSIAGVR